ncbi:MAG: ice-binding protein [Cytophagaceae bacterium]|nr:ice-binding protein [Cytophagaceae bacterium]
MKKTKCILIVLMLVIASKAFGQGPPDLGAAADFVLFTSNGAMTHTGARMNSHITGDVGTHIGGPSSGFGNIDGRMRDGGLGNVVTDLNDAYLEASNQGPATNHLPLFGTETISPGIYTTPLALPSVINGILTLDGGGSQNAYFLFKIRFAFSTAALAEVRLINGAQACNVFWLVEGPVALATGTKMRGNIIAHNGSISMGTNVFLEGRALSTTGAVAVNTGLTAKIPLGCGRAMLTGPAAPDLGTTACYAILTANGALLNTGTSSIIGDVGTQGGGTVTGYTPAMIDGTLHPVGDGSTIQASADLADVVTYLDALPVDIELLYPSEFGHSLVLTPHVYLMSAANPPPPFLTDTVFLNAQGNPDAVFVIKMNAAFIAKNLSNVVLQNGAKSSNVFWLVNGGAVDINDHSIFRGTIISNPGAISLFIGDTIDGRVLSMNGAITTHTVNMAINEGSPVITANGPTTFCQGGSVVLTANPASSYNWSTGAHTQSITVFSSGSYSVSSPNACSGVNASSAVTVVSVNSLPIADFQYLLTGNRTYEFTNQSSGATSYVWNFGDGQTSLSTHPTHTYTSDGSYDVKLIASNSCGKDSMTQTIGLNLEFFNGFSPNGDNHNDDWQIPVLSQHPNNSVLIINRWGSEVWKGTGYDNQANVWTGKNMNGVDLPDGNYYYIIKYDETEKRGWVFVKR